MCTKSDSAGGMGSKMTEISNEITTVRDQVPHGDDLVDDDSNNTRPQKWPEERDCSVSWLRQVYDRWTFSYMNTILDKGTQQALERAKQRQSLHSSDASKTATEKPVNHLTQDDLFPVPTCMKARALSRQFRQHYSPQSDDDQRTSKQRLVSTLWRVAAPTFVPAGFCQLLSVACQVTLPLLVRELLRILEEHPNEKVVQDGLPFALSIFGASILNAFGMHRHRHLALKSGVALRAASVHVLYDHVLSLTPAGRAGLRSGVVTNLVAVDTQKLFEVTQEGHLIWALPLSIILVTIFLLRIMGPTTLVGIVVLILFVPLVERITSSMLAIRKNRVKETDKRIEITNAMLQGIQVTKLNNYEENYRKRVSEARELELIHLKKELAVWALSLLLTVCSPVVATAACFATYVLIDENNILTASETFSVLLLFASLRFPINYAGRLIGKAAQAISAVQRIAHFLERDARHRDQKSEQTDISNKDGDAAILTLAKAGFYVSSEEISGTPSEEDMSKKVTFQVDEFNLSLRRGEILAVSGPVGSGKSTLINGIIDEVPTLAHSTVTKIGKTAYVPQTPFILNATFRDNILFGLPFHKELYERVIDGCCLRTDIEQLGAARDLTEIGERGVTLSGGQKQRVSLARAAYSQPDLVLLDDPLSALDAGTAKLVFERVLKGSGALFEESAVVLVTHASHFLSQVDQITLVVDGKNRFLGTWQDLAAFEPEDTTTQNFVEFVRSSVQEKSSDSAKRKEGETSETISETIDSEKPGGLMTVEEREYGLSSVTVWLLWFQRAGGVFFLSTQVVLMGIDRFLYVGLEYWLATWTKGSDESITFAGIEFPPQTDGRSAQYKYLAVYASLLVVSVLATALRSEWVVTGGARASRRVFSSMLDRVLHAPLSYFETTPMGRILNRFTFDIDVIDIILTEAMSMFIISCSWYVAGVILMSSILPWMIVAIVPVTVVYFFLLLHYRRSGADLQRLDAVSRSPIQAMMSEGLDGSSSIRVFHQEETFGARYDIAVDENSSAMLNFVSGQRWLGLRIELLGSLVVLVSCLLVISLNDSWEIDPGLVGLLILWSGNFTITLGFMVDTFAEVEASITAIERVDAMAHVPQEKPMDTDDTHAVATAWPTHGEVEFNKVCLRYRPGLPLALNDLTFSIPAGKRCGVVGRTGAGKSSLTVALFRLVEIESGCISLDGVDLATLGLSDVRGRGMTIIPQNPFLTGSTLRECLDPFGKHSDAAVFEALNAVRLAKQPRNGSTCTSFNDQVTAEQKGVDDNDVNDGTDDPFSIIYTRVDQGGSNYSVGERQLLNLAAALLSKPVVLVLDEATASVDSETDAFVQTMLRTRFQNTTLITVAHRLHTIMDYDYILAMDKGRAVEMGSPLELLEQRPNGAFSSLVDATGEQGSQELRAMVQSKPKTE